VFLAFLPFERTAMWYVYICDRGGQLYTGITTDLAHRMKQHKAALLYSEPHPDRHAAPAREKQIKGWRMERKLALIRQVSLSSFD
jgi:putative endonuclease